MLEQIVISYELVKASPEPVQMNLLNFKVSSIAEK